jgi:hypothetical protein
MVPDSRAKMGTDQLRPVNRPQSVTILTNNERPVALVTSKRRHRIEQVQDVWRLDDEWWRSPISRRYYRIVLDDGSLRTIYYDLIDGAWYEQAY